MIVLHYKYGNDYYIEVSIETANQPSPAIASKLFGKLSKEAIDDISGMLIKIWQFKESR